MASLLSVASLHSVKYIMEPEEFVGIPQPETPHLCTSMLSQAVIDARLARGVKVGLGIMQDASTHPAERNLNPRPPSLTSARVCTAKPLTMASLREVSRLGLGSCRMPSQGPLSPP